MKKRLVSILMVCMLLITCALPAFAGTGFDESILLNAKDIKHTENTDTGVGWYTTESTSNVWHDSLEDVGGAETKVSLEADILVKRKLSYESFNLYLWVDRKGDTPVTIEKICIQIGNSKEYTYHYLFDINRNADSYQHKHSDGSQWLKDSFYVCLGEDSFAMLQDMIDNRDGYVQIWIQLDGSEKFIKCTMLGQDEIDGIIHLYNLYKQAGGLSEDNLKALEGKNTRYKAVHKMAYSS